MRNIRTYCVFWLSKNDRGVLVEGKGNDAAGKHFVLRCLRRASRRIFGLLFLIGVLASFIFSLIFKNRELSF